MSRKIIKVDEKIDGLEFKRIAEVSEEKIEAWPDNDKLRYVGKPLPRYDGYDKVSGTAVYTFDKVLPRMAHAVILRSPYPHARIKNIDTSAAEKSEGVFAVISHKNCPEIKWYGESSLLFDPHVRYEGDEVAAVLAENEILARSAIKKIKVDYEELPFVVDPEKAMKEDAPKIHEKGNISRGPADNASRGDYEKAEKEADVIVEGTFKTPIAIHNPTEVHCSVVNWDGDNLDVWDSTQGIYSVRDTVAYSLGVPTEKVRVIKKYMGGGFGSKLEAGKYTVIAALLAKRTGLPVKITLDRKEMNLAVGNRPDSIQKLKAAANKAGKLLGLYHHSIGQVGAYDGGAGCAWPLRTLYQCDNVKVEEYSVMTNAGNERPFRAPGHVQGAFALEAIMDELAEKLNMDPLELRKLNYAPKDQVWGPKYTSKMLIEAYDQGAEKFGWKKKFRPPASDKGHIKRGVGLASQIWWGGGTPPAGVILKLNRDGSVRLIAGTQDIGGGTYTWMAQIAAEVLEISPDKIEVILGDTATGPQCPVSGGSLTAPSVSPAVREAAENMKKALLNAASVHLDTPADKLVYKNGVISINSEDEKKLGISEIMGKMHESTLVTTGARNANPDGYIAQTFGVQFAEVEVDTLTGEIKVLNITAAYDTGRVLNKMTYENQVEGGIMMGLGFALTEERVLDEYTGKVVNGNMHDYKMPTIIDTPDEINVISVNPGDDLLSNTGVKGVGEPAMIPAAAAIGNAVYNAIGVRINELPITPDKVISALYKG